MCGDGALTWPRLRSWGYPAGLSTYVLGALVWDLRSVGIPFSISVRETKVSPSPSGFGLSLSFAICIP